MFLHTLACRFHYKYLDLKITSQLIKNFNSYLKYILLFNSAFIVKYIGQKDVIFKV